MAISIRAARAEDAPSILAMLRALADYEKLLSTFTLGEGEIARDFFGPRPVAEAALAWRDETPVGLMTWYWTYASFRAMRGLFIEDLFVPPDHRGQGIGMALLSHAARLAQSCGARLEWRVLDWNAPSIAFYKKLGAQRLEGWDTYRLEGAAMERLLA
jgi:GNAT superfamily N-acetyltransferase